MYKVTLPQEASTNGMYPLHKLAKCLISLLKEGKTLPFTLLDALSNLFCQQSRRVQRRMAKDLFCLLLYGSIGRYEFADTGDDKLDDVLNDMFGEIIYRLRGIDFFMKECGMTLESAMKLYLSILKNYPQ